MPLLYESGIRWPPPRLAQPHRRPRKMASTPGRQRRPNQRLLVLLLAAIAALAVVLLALAHAFLPGRQEDERELKAVARTLTRLEHEVRDLASAVERIELALKPDPVRSARSRAQHWGDDDRSRDGGDDDDDSFKGDNEPDDDGSIGGLKLPHAGPTTSLWPVLEERPNDGRYRLIEKAKPVNVTIRCRANGKFLAVSSRDEVRAAARSATRTLATVFTKLRYEFGVTGRPVTAFRSVQNGCFLRAVSQRDDFFTGEALPSALKADYQTVSDAEVWSVADASSLSDAAHGTRVARARGRGCVAYALEQGPPRITLHVDDACGGADESESTVPLEQLFDVQPARAVALALAPTALQPTGLTIALGVAVKTREPTPASELELLNVLVPSLRRTLLLDGADRRFHIELYLGFDSSDPTYDAQPAAGEVLAAVREELDGLRVRVRPVRIAPEDTGSPCWAWNALLRTACTAGADYMYQLNDDLVLVSPGWASAFVDALNGSSPPNLGIAGGLDRNNGKIMTQSFVHCTHFEVFGTYFPRVFRNWYSDDWASSVYGAERTHWLTDVEVDHSATKGPRYNISYEDGALLEEEVAVGRERIQRWLATTASSHRRNSSPQPLWADY